jgi:outer membrane lipoprotein-sorting protein
MIGRKVSLAVVLSASLAGGLTGAACADPAAAPNAVSPAPAPPAPPAPAPRAAPAAPTAQGGGASATAHAAVSAAPAAPSQPATAPASANGAPFVPIDPAVAIQKANAYFNSATTMVGDFVQISGGYRRSEGKIYVQKPGKLRFEYADPASLDIIADGSTVAVIDRKDRSDPEFYFIWQTPLKFLLKDQIDLAKDVTVTGVTSDPDTVTISLEDKATFGGTSQIKLMFDTATFQLKQWDVTDPQGNETLVSLFNVNFTDPPDPDLFKITENHLDDTDSRRLNQSN